MYLSMFCIHSSSTHGCTREREWPQEVIVFARGLQTCLTSCLEPPSRETTGNPENMLRIMHASICPCSGILQPVGKGAEPLEADYKYRMLGNVGGGVVLLGLLLFTSLSMGVREAAETDAASQIERQLKLPKASCVSVFASDLTICRQSSVPFSCSTGLQASQFLALNMWAENTRPQSKCHRPSPGRT